ncbi:hypothetical protein J6590_056692 [Homalodisca vitripennis]|nr:hypothetical protein J6590_056692 [Homalodisca vitripennis]
MRHHQSLVLDFLIQNAGVRWNVRGKYCRSASTAGPVSNGSGLVSRFTAVLARLNREAARNGDNVKDYGCKKMDNSLQERTKEDIS